MNFLAHLHLADRTPESRIGNMLGDFVRGLPWDDRFPRAIWEGIMLHRRIDAFTDCHADWKRSRARLDPEMRRFAGIVIDVFYDHFLARHWERFSVENEPLEDFVDGCHRDLLSKADLAPAEAAAVFERMADEEWLISYREIKGIESALNRISRRSSVLESLRETAGELERNYDEMEADFLAFYPDLIAYVADMRTADSL